MKVRRRQVDRRGFALVAVLWVVIVAGMVLLGAQKATRANLVMSYNELASVRAHWLARAGVERALAALEDDSVYDAGADGVIDGWFDDAQLFEEVQLTGGSFSVMGGGIEWVDPRQGRFGLIDHAGRLNVNHADASALGNLGVLAEWQVNAILDWRDADNNVRAGGAEGAWYDQLPYPYLIRNGSLETVAELRLVRDIDEWAYVGEDADLDGVLDAGEDDFAATDPPDNGDGELQRGLAGLTTVWSYERNLDAAGNKRTNVNTADKDKLKETFNLTDGLAEAITQHKSGKSSKAPGGKSSKAQRFNSLMELMDVRPKRKASDDEKNKIDKIDLKWLAGHLDELTLTDDERLPARINVNTAPADVLATLPKMDPRTAERIIQQRMMPAGRFESVGGLFLNKVLDERQFKAMAERITVRSNVFEIRSRGVTTWGVRKQIVAVVDRGTKPVTILHWYQSE